MSASNKKKEKAASPAEAMKQQRASRIQEEEQKQTRINTAIAAVVAVVILFLVLWNQGLFQDDTAFQIDGQKFSATAAQTQYTDILYNAIMGYYAPEEGGESYDLSLYSDEQMYSATETWHDFFSKEACKALALDQTIANIATTEGYILPSSATEQLEATKAQLDTAWIGVTNSKSAYFNAYLGMSEKDYLSMTEMSLYADNYKYDLYLGYEHSDQEVDDFYDENKDSMDLLQFSQITFMDTDNFPYDEEGNEIELDTEAQAIFDGQREIIQREAQTSLEALEEGATIDEVLEDYATTFVTYASLHQEELSALYSNQTDEIGTWLLDEDRKEGDFTLIDVPGTLTSYQTLVVFESRERAEFLLSDIRVLLVPTETQEEPDEDGTEAELTDEDWDNSEEIAKDLLSQWESGDKTPESFSDLAYEHSTHSSASTGGVVSSLTPYDITAYSTAVIEWYSDSSRKPGDTTIIKEENSTAPGWIILHFDDWGMPFWENNTRNSLSLEKIEAWEADQTDYVEANISYGAGISAMQAASLMG